MKTAAFKFGPGRFVAGLLLLFTGLGVATTVQAQGTGYWHTSGDLLLDANNARVRIAGINWYGFETSTAVPHGLMAQDYKTILQTIKSNGYNTVRLPFSNQMIETPGTNLSIGYVNATGAINTELQGLNSLQVMDKIIVAAGNLGLKVVLDNHRSEAGTSAEANGLWFTTSYPESAWIADWTMLAKRYQYNATVIGFDLRNEPHNATSGGACWDCGGANDWHLAAQRAGNAVLAANPSLLIFVEGTDTYNGDSYWWGGNLEGVAQSPVTLAVANHLVYSAHEYGPHEYAQKWFDANTSYATLSTVWNKHWAYISQNNLAPVWVAEFGTTNAASDVDSTVAGSQGQWFQSLVNFLNADPTLNWSYWAVNGEDAYALLDANYNIAPVSAVKQAKLATIQFALRKGITTGAAPAAPSNLTATAVSTSQISLAWTPSTTAGSYYTVSFGTIPGNTVTTLVSGVSTPAYQATGLNAATTYYFVVSTVSSGGTSAASNQATATTKSALTAPSAPTGVAAATVSTSQINVSWNAVAGTGVTYSVYSGTTAGGTALVASGLTTTAYASTGLSANTTYFYSVRAENAAGSSPASATVSAKSQDARASPPDAPTALTATSVSSTQINVGWTASAGTGVTYNVYAGTSTNTVTALLGSGVSGTSFAAAGLNPATTYFFDVVAVSSAGSSGVSAMVSATTQAAVATPPAAPTGLTAVPVSSYAIHLAWSASTSAANTPGLTYNVFGRTAASSTNSLLASNVTGTAFTVSGLTPGTVYSFYVVAVNGVLWSQPSNVVNAMTPGIVAPPSLPNPPTGLTAVAVSDTQINLAWQASTTTGVTYTVYQGAGAGAGAVAIASNVTSTSFAVSGLKASSTYFFVVQAVSAAGSSAASNEASAVTQAAAIACHVSYNVYTDWVTGFTTGISITNTSTGALTSWTLSWSFAGNQQVAQGWSGDFTQSGKNVTVHNASWNGDIAAGATLVGVGFNGSYNGSNPTPTAFSLNGVPCK